MERPCASSVACKTLVGCQLMRLSRIASLLLRWKFIWDDLCFFLEGPHIPDLNWNARCCVHPIVRRSALLGTTRTRSAMVARPLGLAQRTRRLCADRGFVAARCPAVLPVCTSSSTPLASALDQRENSTSFRAMAYQSALEAVPTRRRNRTIGKARRGGSLFLLWKVADFF